MSHKIKFLFIGKAKNKHYEALESDYLNRLNKMIKSECRILPDGRVDDVTQRRQRETESLLDEITGQDFVIVLDETGQNLTTQGMTQKLSQWLMMPQRLVFVVGGAYGFDKGEAHNKSAFLKRANAILCLSQMTLPHELARVVLVEQIYRSFTLLNNIGYHH